MVSLQENKITGVADGLCHCPSINEVEIRNNKHIICGGILPAVIKFEKKKKRRNKDE